MLIGAIATSCSSTIWTWLSVGLALHPREPRSAHRRTVADVGDVLRPLLTVSIILFVSPIGLAAVRGAGFPRWLAWLTGVFVVGTGDRDRHGLRAPRIRRARRPVELHPRRRPVFHLAHRGRRDGDVRVGHMTAYVIVQGEVTDPEQYEKYKVAAAAATVTAAGGKYIVRGGGVEAFEGDSPPTRTVVLEFPNMQAAHDWYHGEQYTAARKLREGAGNMRFYAVDGSD